jgi:hypothetical protein
MSARDDVTPEQIEAVDRFISGPAAGDRHKARARQITAVARMLVYCEILITEAAEARIPAPGILELRAWAEYCLTEHACIASPPLNIQPDPVKDAVAASVAAARSGNGARYAAARAEEADARAAV